MAKRVKLKERIVGKKETFKVGEKMKLQDIKSKLSNTEGVVTRVRTAGDGTIVSYDINTDGCVTTRHRRYMSKVRNADEEIESSENTGAENQAGAANRAGSQQ